MLGKATGIGDTGKGSDAGAQDAGSTRQTFPPSVEDGTQNFVGARLYHVAMPLALLGKVLG